MANAKDVQAGGAFVKVYADNSALSRGLKQIQAKFALLGKAVNATLRPLRAGFAAAAATMATVASNLGNVSAKLKSAGMSLAKIGVGLGVVAGSSLAAFASFESGMANVSTMVDNTKAHMGNLGAGVKSLSVEFGQGTDVMQKGLYDILSASIAPDKALAVLRDSAKAAAAGMTDTGVSADAITTILNSYGKAAEQSGLVSDILFTIVKRGKTTFGALAPVIGMVTSIAASAEVPFEHLGAMLALLTRNGVQTENAVTAVKNVIVTFLKPTDEAASLANSLGFELSAAALKAEGLEGVFKRIAHLPPDVIATLFPNMRALTGVMPALKKIAEFGGDLKAMGNAAGATDEAFKKISGTLTFLGKQIKQAGLAILVAFGEGFADTARAAGEKIMQIAQNVTAWVRENQGLASSLLQVTAAVLASAGVLLTLSLGVKAVAFAFSGLSVAITVTKLALAAASVLMGALLSPIGIVTAAAVGIALAFTDVSDTITRVAGAVGVGMNDIKSTAITAWGAITEAFKAGDVVGAQKILWATIKSVWAAGVATIYGDWESLKQFLHVSVVNMQYDLVNLWNAIPEVFEKAMVKVKFALLQACYNIHFQLQKGFLEIETLARKAYHSLLRIFGIGTGKGAEKADALYQTKYNELRKQQKAADDAIKQVEKVALGEVYRKRRALYEQTEAARKSETEDILKESATLKGLRKDAAEAKKALGETIAAVESARNVKKKADAEGKPSKKAEEKESGPSKREKEIAQELLRLQTQMRLSMADAKKAMDKALSNYSTTGSFTISSPLVFASAGASQVKGLEEINKKIAGYQKDAVRLLKEQNNLMKNGGLKWSA